MLQNKYNHSIHRNVKVYITKHKYKYVYTYINLLFVKNNRNHFTALKR